MRGLYSITIREPKIDDLMSQGYDYFGELNENHNRVALTTERFHHLPGPGASVRPPTVHSGRSRRDRFDPCTPDRWHWRRAARGSDDRDHRRQDSIDRFDRQCAGPI